MIYFCRRLPSARRRERRQRGWEGGWRGVKEGGISPHLLLLPTCECLLPRELTRSSGRFNHFISRLESFIRLTGVRRGEDRKGGKRKKRIGRGGGEAWRRRGQLVTQLRCYFGKARKQSSGSDSGLHLPVAAALVEIPTAVFML